MYWKERTSGYSRLSAAKISGAVVGNKLWENFKVDIRNFTTEYS